MTKKTWLKKCALAVAAAASIGAHAADTGKLRIGVYYFGGWYPGAQVYTLGKDWCGADNPGGRAQLDPWCVISYYPERTPATTPIDSSNLGTPGFYNAKDKAVLLSQVKQMSNNGLSYVVFDWNAADDGAHLVNGMATQVNMLFGAPLKAYKDAAQDPSFPSQFAYGLFWDTSSGIKRTNLTSGAAPMHWSEFKAAAAALMAELGDPQAKHLLVGSKPVLIVSVDDSLKHVGQLMPMDDGDPPPADIHNGSGNWLGLMTQVIRAAAQTAFPNGIQLVASTAPVKYWSDLARSAGYDALTAYNYHTPFNFAGNAAGPQSTSYVFDSNTFNTANTVSLTNDYVANWIATGNYAKDANMQFYAPLTTGWDHRPWDTNPDTKVGYERHVDLDCVNAPTHNCSTPQYPQAFELQLRIAKNLLADDNNAAVTQYMATICCWNEYGEGSILEPTVDPVQGQLLETVKRVFVTPPAVTVLGNSITRRAPMDGNLCWKANRGMAATDDSKDFVHVLQARLDAYYRGIDADPNVGKITMNVLNVPVESVQDNDSGNVINATLGAIAPAQDVIVVELGDDIVNPGAFNTYFPIFLDKLVATKLKPGGKLLCTGTWFGGQNDVTAAIIPSSCVAHGGTFVDLSAIRSAPGATAAADGIYTNRVCTTPGASGDTGVVIHPGNTSHSAIAEALFQAYRSAN